MEVQKIEEKIKEIEKEIQDLPYHKATEHHIGKLKAKLAKLRDQMMQKKIKKGGGGGFAIKKQGDATIVLVGLPSVGKSTLLNQLTEAESKVAEYDFTTLTVIPGMLDYEGAQIQIMDVPGLIEDAAMGRGRGKEVLSVIRIADLVLLMASPDNPESWQLMEKELSLAGVRLNQKKPDILIEKKLRDGLEILNRPSDLSEKTIRVLFQEFGLPNARIVFKDRIGQDQLIDLLMANRVYVPVLKILNKADLVSFREQERIAKKYQPDLIISAKKQAGLEGLKKAIWNKLNLMRIYLKESARARPQTRPLVCRPDIRVLEAARLISEELAQEIKGAKINGPSVIHENQLVGVNHRLKDKDQVFFVKQ